MNNTDFERIAQLLREDSPKTPQEISIYTKIPLNCVYDILQNNKYFFREIIINESLIGWTLDNGL